MKDANKGCERLEANVGYKQRMRMFGGERREARPAHQQQLDPPHTHICTHNAVG